MNAPSEKTSGISRAGCDERLLCLEKEADMTRFDSFAIPPAASFWPASLFASVFLQVDGTAGRRLKLCARHYPLSLRRSLDPGLLTLSITLVIPCLPALVAPSVRLILSAC